MRVIEQYHMIETPIDGAEILRHIELCGRVCYKSEDKITEASCLQFVRNVIKRGHEAVLEHYNITVRFVTDRGVSHEIVRHRLASFCQESTRYCNYGKDKFGKNITFIKPVDIDEKSHLYNQWWNGCGFSESAYLCMMKDGATPEQARSVLNNSTKTEIIMTANLREWRHFLKLRTSKAAHPQMRSLARGLLTELKERVPIVFDDIVYEE